ncbi:MAG: hypothetical protein AABY95_03550 [Pseudomonadota bacterium]
MRKACLILIAAMLVSAPLGAETLAVHKSKAKAQSMGYPTRGQTSKQVIAKFGEPKLKHAPVGGGAPKQPPITRWDYEGFSVFFDAGHVIDTVVKDQPPEISHKDELQPVQPPPLAPAPVPAEPAPEVEEPITAPNELPPAS